MGGGRGFIHYCIILSKEDINLHTISDIYLDDGSGEQYIEHGGFRLLGRVVEIRRIVLR